MHDELRARVFISYARGVDSDESIARAIAAALRDRHAVRVDVDLAPDAAWAELSGASLLAADVLVALLSEQAVHSELVGAELAVTRRGERPRLLPVRVAYAGAFPYPLGAYVEVRACLTWDG